MDESVAIETLRFLTEKPGALRIIHPLHLCQPGDPVLKPSNLALCAAYPFDGSRFGDTLHDPAHFFQTDVTAIEGPDAEGKMKAWSSRGDYCVGFPVPLLKRLLEASGN